MDGPGAVQFVACVASRLNGAAGEDRLILDEIRGEPFAVFVPVGIVPDRGRSRIGGVTGQYLGDNFRQVLVRRGVVEMNPTPFTGHPADVAGLGRAGERGEQIVFEGVQRGRFPLVTQAIGAGRLHRHFDLDQPRTGRFGPVFTERQIDKQRRGTDAEPSGPRPGRFDRPKEEIPVLGHALTLPNPPEATTPRHAALECAPVRYGNDPARSRPAT